MIHVTLEPGGGPPQGAKPAGKLRLEAKLERGPGGALKLTMTQSAPQMTVSIAKLP